jgi:hypothetical protein
MKIFALTCFVLCLFTVLSLQVESFEEGKPKAKATGIATCSKVSLKGTTLKATCNKVKNTINLSKCKGKALKKLGKACKISKNVISCTTKGKKGKKTVAKFDLVKIMKLSKKNKLTC